MSKETEREFVRNPNVEFVVVKVPTQDGGHDLSLVIGMIIGMGVGLIIYAGVAKFLFAHHLLCG